MGPPGAAGPKGAAGAKVYNIIEVYTSFYYL